jgi:D-sedoheptulose 7-phosphate isomerase
MYYEDFFEQLTNSVKTVDKGKLDKMVNILLALRKRSGRLFIIGSGGGAGNASHAVCDFRKICEIEAYAPYDNVSELTARTNDEGYGSTIKEWLQISKFNEKDCLFVFSVGGGSETVSSNIVNALKLANSIHANIIGIVGNDGNMTKKLADVCINIFTDDYYTPITEGMQCVLWHLLVTHPKLQKNLTKW